jgi:hypothetical protein
MVFNLTHSQIIIEKRKIYKENGGRIEPYTIVIMGLIIWTLLLRQLVVVATTSCRDNNVQMIRPLSPKLDMSYRQNDKIT